MNRRTILGETAAATAILLAGCSGDTSGDADGGPTDTTGGGATTGATTTGPGELSSDRAIGHLETVYEAWVKLDSEAFLATLHSTNNYPEEAVRSTSSEIDFEGTLVELNAEVLEENLGTNAIGELFESGQNLNSDDATTFIDVRNLSATVDPTVEGDAATEAQENIKTFLESEKQHFLAVEDGEWQFVL